MKLRVEVGDFPDEEIIIRCRRINDDIKFLQDTINNMIIQNAELSLYMDDTEYFVPSADVLFFETESSKTAAHTADMMYYTDYRLYELEKLLPGCFVRVSKSCIINTAKVSAVVKNVTGASEVHFAGCLKKIYVSRGYYKLFREKIEETRLKK